MTTEAKTEDWKEIAEFIGAFAGSVHPLLGAGVKAGVIAVDLFNDYVETQEKIDALLAQDKVTVAQIRALRDSIKARTDRINAKD